MKITITILKLVLFIIIIFFLLQYNIVDIPNLSVFTDQISNVIFIFILISINIILGAYKWWLLLLTFQYNISYKISYLLYSVGVFFNSIMPGGFGGDIIKGTYLFKYIQEDYRTQSILTIIVDRIIGMHALIPLCLFSGIYISSQLVVDEQLSYIIDILTAITFLMLIFLGAIIFNAHYIKNLFENRIKIKIKKLQNIIIKILNALEKYKEKKNSILLCWLLSLINHCVLIYCFLIMAKILNILFINFDIISFITSASLLANYIPLTPGGIGIGEGTFNYLFILILEQNHTLNNIAYGSIFFLTYRVIFTMASILLGGISFIMLKKPDYKIKN